VLVVDLPDAPVTTVIHQAGVVRAAAASMTGAGVLRQAMFDSLAWCWEAITEPVLTALGYTHTPQARIEDWPRVWWCPTGPATLLPLHAAGRHPRTTAQHAAMGEARAIADTVAGRVLSSYTQSLATLARARAQPAPSRVRQLAVGVSRPPRYAPGLPPLPAVPAELQVLAGYLPPPGQATHLLDQAATRQAVMDALPGHAWLHLSCHAGQHADDAWLSAFFLDDQPLTLADLAGLRLGHETDLAFLSACETAVGDLLLPDESVHLAGAVQLAGYRHVLATLWSVSDNAAPAMADTIYAQLRHPGPDHPAPVGRPQAARAPYALHHAVTRLRQDHPDEPLLWAPYIHLGP
jgi:CHAT domain